MSWLRNGQVSLVAVAVSAAMGLAACGGAESDRENGKSTHDSAVDAFERTITESNAAQGFSLGKFKDLAGDDEILDFNEANGAILKDRKATVEAEYISRNTPSEASFDTDGVQGLSAEERALFNAAAAKVAAEAKAEADKILLKDIPHFADQAALLAALDSNGDGKITAAGDYNLNPPPDVEGIALAAITGDASDLYLRGDITSWEAADLTDAHKFVKNGSVYEIDYVAVKEGFGKFKIADKNWTGATNCGVKDPVVLGAKTADLETKLKEGTVGECSGGSPDVRVYFYKGTYRIKVDMSDAAKPKFWVIKNSGGASSVIPAPVLALKAAVKDAVTFTAADTDKDKSLSFAEAKAKSPELTNLQFLSLDANLDLKLSADELDIALIPPVTVDCGTEVTADDGNLYLRGSLTGKDWPAGQKCKFTKTGNTYSLGLDLPGNPTEKVQFKIASPGWSPTNCGGAAGAGDLDLGVSKNGVCGGNPADLSLLIAEAGYYKFELNLADPANPVFKVAKSSKTVACEGELPDAVSDGKEINDKKPVYVRGDLTLPKWDALPAFKTAYKGNGIYQLRFSPAQADFQFKVASDAGDWAPSYTLSSALALGVEAATTAGTDNTTMKGLSTSGVYLLTASLTADSGKLKVVECK